MQRFWRFLGLPALAAALISGLNLAPAFAQGMYWGGGYTSGGGYMSSGGSMPYRAPAPYGGSGHGTAPSYQSPSHGYPTNRMQYGSRYGSGYGNKGYSSGYGDDDDNSGYGNKGYSSGYGDDDDNSGYGNNGYSSGYGNNGYNAYSNRAVLYTVQFGDTLSKIARRFGTSVDAILRANPGIEDPDVIFAGQTLVIPTAGYGGKYAAPAPYSAPAPYGKPAPAPYRNMAPAPYGNTAPAPYQMPAPAPAPVPPPAPAPAPAPAPQTVTVNLTAHNLAFSLSTITVPAGAQVVVNFDNQDAGVPHNFAVYTDSSAQQAIFRGQIVTGPGTMTYMFTAPSQPGTYFFRCDVHFTMMTGQFVVG